MKTYQDLLALGTKEQERQKFILSAIAEHKASNAYKLAADAELYYKHLNPTIMRFQKYVYDQFGRKVPDIWAANNKIASNWYNYFTTQAVSYLLGNGITFGKDETKEKLGKNFDKRVKEALIASKNGSVSFGLPITLPVLLEESALRPSAKFPSASNKPSKCSLLPADKRIG